MSFIESFTQDFAQVIFVVLWSHTSFLAHLSQKLKLALLIEICPMSVLVVVNFSQFHILPGADPGIYVSGGALDRRGVWGPPRSSGGPGQRPVGSPWGRSPPEAHEN